MIKNSITELQRVEEPCSKTHSSHKKSGWQQKKIEMSIYGTSITEQLRNFKNKKIEKSME